MLQVHSPHALGVDERHLHRMTREVEEEGRKDGREEGRMLVVARMRGRSVLLQLCLRLRVWLSGQLLPVRMLQSRFEKDIDAFLNRFRDN